MLEMLSSFLVLESRMLIKKPSKLIYPGIFYLIILSVLPFTISNEILAIKVVVVAFLTISILFVIHVNCLQVFDEDIKDGFLEQIIMTGRSLSVFILTKIIFNTLMLFIPIIVTFPILVLFFNFSKEIFLQFSFLSLAISFALVATVSFSSALTTGLKNGFVITLIISFPLSLSLLIEFSIVCNELVSLGFIKDERWLVWVIVGKIFLITPLVVYLSNLTLTDAINYFK